VGAGLPAIFACGFDFGVRPKKDRGQARSHKSKDRGQGRSHESRAQRDPRRYPCGIMAAMLPLPPEAPLPGDCCGDGCPRCVLDVYEEKLAAWRLAVAAALAADPEQKESQRKD
jgi:hypothetical protein